jgi:hypothetical protein
MVNALLAITPSLYSTMHFVKPCLLIILALLLLAALPVCAQTQDSTMATDTAWQRDLIDIGKATLHLSFKKIPPRRGRKVYYSLIPTTTNIPGGGKGIITATEAGFYMGPRYITSISSVVFSPYLSFTGRFGLPLRSNLWLRQNKFNILGDTRFLVYPQYTWGLGGNSHNPQRVLVNYKYIRFYQSVLKQMAPHVYAGIGYALDYHVDIKTIGDTIGLQKFTGYNQGTAQGQNSFSSGLLFNVLYDSRVNTVNPASGEYASIVLRANKQFLGSNTNWQSLNLDLRKYYSFNRRRQDVLALWAYYWTVLNAGVPYLDLPSIGWDSYQRSGRGFDQNRYRGNGLVDLEAEYRRDITANGLFGCVVFANANSVTEQNAYKFIYWHPAVGIGLRIKFNKLSGTNVAVDYAVSKGFSSFYVNLGEVF